MVASSAEWAISSTPASRAEIGTTRRLRFGRLSSHREASAIEVYVAPLEAQHFAQPPTETGPTAGGNLNFEAGVLISTSTGAVLREVEAANGRPDNPHMAAEWRARLRTRAARGAILGTLCGVLVTGLDWLGLPSNFNTINFPRPLSDIWWKFPVTFAIFFVLVLIAPKWFWPEHHE